MHFSLFLIRIKNWLKRCLTFWLTRTITTSTRLGTPQRCSRAPSFASSTAKSRPSYVRTINPKRAPSTSTQASSQQDPHTHKHTHFQHHTHYAEFRCFTLPFLFFFLVSHLWKGEKLQCSLYVAQSYRANERVPFSPRVRCRVDVFVRLYERLHDQSRRNERHARFNAHIKSVLYRQKKAVACQRREKNLTGASCDRTSFFQLS